MNKHLEIFKDMIEGEVEFPSNLRIEHRENDLLYLIDEDEAVVWDEDKEVDVADYSDEVMDMISDRVDHLERDHQAEKETENYLRVCR